MIFTLWIIVTVTFGLMHIIPGDPLGEKADKLPKQVRDNFYAKWGLNKSVPEQYLIYLKGIITNFNFGESVDYPGRTVVSIIKKTAPISARIGIQGLLFGVVLGITLGIVAAFNRGHYPDYIVMIIALLGVSIPGFVFAALLQFVFGFKLKLFPITGFEGFKYTVLPALALGLRSIAIYARYMRSSTLDVINQDYILTAKAKGVSEISLVWKHIIRNAILPAITILGPQIAYIFVGSFVIENIFSIPGFGQYYVTSVASKDYMMIMGQTIMLAGLYMISLLVVDIVYGFVDPRIRVSGKAE
jgi:oligopeptide transport system permease protein